MTKKDQTEVLDTIRYCLGHCDTDEERDIVLWVAEKLADAGQCIRTERMNR